MILQYLVLGMNAEVEGDKEREGRREGKRAREREGEKQKGERRKGGMEGRREIYLTHG